MIAALLIIFSSPVTGMLWFIQIFKSMKISSKAAKREKKDDVADIYGL